MQWHSMGRATGVVALGVNFLVGAEFQKKKNKVVVINKKVNECIFFLIFCRILHVCTCHVSHDAKQKRIRCTQQEEEEHRAEAKI